MQPIPGLSLIVAMTIDRVIGRENTLPWRLPSDLRRFKEITTREGIIVMGRTTYDSIVARNGSVLPLRHHIVLTTRPLPNMGSVQSVANLQEACVAIEERGGRACIIGGEQIYKLFLPLVQTAYVTNIHASIEGDTYFPRLEPDRWQCVEASRVQKWHPNDEYSTSFRIYEQRQS